MFIIEHYCSLFLIFLLTILITINIFKQARTYSVNLGSTKIERYAKKKTPKIIRREIGNITSSLVAVGLFFKMDVSRNWKHNVQRNTILTYMKSASLDSGNLPTSPVANGTNVIKNNHIPLIRYISVVSLSAF